MSVVGRFTSLVILVLLCADTSAQQGYPLRYPGPLPDQTEIPVVAPAPTTVFHRTVEPHELTAPSPFPNQFAQPAIEDPPVPQPAVPQAPYMKSVMLGHGDVEVLRGEPTESLAPVEYGPHAMELWDPSIGQPISDPNPISDPISQPVDLYQPIDPPVEHSMGLPANDAWCLPRVWASAEYVYWWVDGSDVPALVTTSEPGTSQDNAARLGLSTSSVLFGANELNSGGRSGARFTLGGWFDLCNMVGVELNFLVLGNEETSFTSSDELEILGRPFFNLTLDQQDAKLINFPGLVEGSLNASMKSEFHTGEALLRKRVRAGITALDWYVGYRNAGLVDDIRIVETSSVLSGPVDGTQFFVSDQFRTRNTFHGVDLGVRFAELLRPSLEVEVLAKVALGSTYSETEIIGLSETSLGGVSTTSDIGFLVQPTNAGVFSDDYFSTVTELSVGGRRMFRPGLSLMVGYTFFFWHDVVRAGEQIDNTINVSQFPPGVLNGEARPVRRDRRTNFTAHGFRIGFEYLF